ncbi:MAG: hypothetical protein ABFQ62_05500 [Patescibacteria group bacterium]
MSKEPDLSGYTPEIRNALCMNNTSLLSQIILRVFRDLSPEYAGMSIQILINGNVISGQYTIPKLDEIKSSVDDPRAIETRRDAIPTISVIQHIIELLKSEKKIILESHAGASIFELIYDENVFWEDAEQ